MAGGCLRLLACALLVAAAGGRLDQQDSTALPPICSEQEGCKCSRTAAGYWVQVACTCVAGQTLLEIRPDQLPPELRELELSGCREVRVLGGALSLQSGLRSVSAVRLGTLIVRKNAFLNSTATSALLKAENCSAVVLESGAWRGTTGPHSVWLSRCRHVLVQPAAFSWLQDFRADHVERLELQKNAFSQPGASVGRHGPATKVVIEDAVLSEIPSGAFPSSAAELRLERCAVRAVRKDAFCGLHVLQLVVRDCVLRNVERGALSARTLVHKLTLEGLRETNLNQGAVQSAVSNLTLTDSKLLTVGEGAFNITVASVTMSHNTFQHVSSRGFVFQDYTSLEVRNNTFSHLQPSGIWSFSERPQRRGRFVFADNVVGETDPGGGTLHFGPEMDQMEISVYGNRFDRQCQCGLESWLRREVGPRAGEVAGKVYSEKWTNFWVESFHNTSLCVVTNVLARCFGDTNIEVGYMNMTTFWVKVCEARAVIVCKGSGGDQDETFVIEKPFDETHRAVRGYDQTKLLIILMLAVLLCVISLTTYCYGKKMYRQHPNTLQSISSSLRKFFQLLCRSENVNLAQQNTEAATLPIGTAGTVITNSIDHLPGHEYAELDGRQRRRKRRKRRPHRRDMGITVSEDLDLTDVTKGSSSDSETGTDRTGSTLECPCEDKGTQTIPETSDLTMELLAELKEKLNDPNFYSETRDVIEHLYDLIKVEDTSSLPSTSGHNLRRVPEEVEEDSSEDETYDVIQPVRTTAAVCEYQEPQDRKHHVYTELPGRAVSFFRSLLPRPNRRRQDEETPMQGSSAAVSEYMEPTDSQVHVYTELPANMANRPLPNKPRQDTTDESGDESS